MRHELNGLRINTTSFPLDLAPGHVAPPWSDDARVEFVFCDESHWVAQPTGAGQLPRHPPTGRKHTVNPKFGNCAALKRGADSHP
jgi:hypothetical protein